MKVEFAFLSTDKSHSFLLDFGAQAWSKCADRYSCWLPEPSALASSLSKLELAIDFCTYDSSQAFNPPEIVPFRFFFGLPGFLDFLSLPQRFAFFGPPDFFGMIKFDQNSDFVKCHPYENCSKSVIFESSVQIPCIFIEYTVGNLQKKQFFLKITHHFFFATFRLIIVTWRKKWSKIVNF